MEVFIKVAVYLKDLSTVFISFTNSEQVMEKSWEGDGWGHNIIMITFLFNQNPHSRPN